MLDPFGSSVSVQDPRPSTVVIWDLDETLILFNSLLTGHYMQQAPPHTMSADKTAELERHAVELEVVSFQIAVTFCDVLWYDALHADYLSVYFRCWAEQANSQLCTRSLKKGYSSKSSKVATAGVSPRLMLTTMAEIFLTCLMTGCSRTLTEMARPSQQPTA